MWLCIYLYMERLQVFLVFDYVIHKDNYKYNENERQFLCPGVFGLTLWTVWCTCLTVTPKMSKAIIWGSYWVYYSLPYIWTFKKLIYNNLCENFITQFNSCTCIFFSRWIPVASYDNSQSDIDVMFEYKYSHFFIITFFLHNILSIDDRWCIVQVHCGHLVVWGDVKRGRDFSHSGGDNAGIIPTIIQWWIIDDPIIRS